MLKTDVYQRQSCGWYGKAENKIGFHGHFGLLLFY